MKKIRYLFFILVSFFATAQSGPNPFAEKASDNTFSKVDSAPESEQKSNKPQSADSGGGSPGDPLPIDNYIPILVLTAVGMIIYKTFRENKIST